MLDNNKETIQLLNTAIIKSKEKMIDSSYEDRLARVCQGPVMKVIGNAATELSQSQNISRDQAMISIIETLRELDSIWNDYVAMEGISRLKSSLKSN